MAVKEDNVAFVKYEYARRQRLVKNEKIKTSYGSFRFWVSTSAELQELKNNMTRDYWDGDWFRIIPVEVRLRLTRLRWMDLGAHAGWFGMKLVCKLNPNAVYSTECNEARFSFLRHTHMNYANNDCLGIVFQHVVNERAKNTHRATVTFNEDGYLDIKGKREAEVPIIEYAELRKKRNLNAIRCDLNGYEKDILLQENLQGIKFLMAKCRKGDYNDKEWDKLKKKLAKSFDVVRRKKADKKGAYFFICYNKDMIVEK
jgi:hypothetical protein